MRAICPLLLLSFVTGAGAAANESAGPATIACVNTVSRAGWQIRVDYQKNTVNALPAHITAGEITWYDDKEHANYTLDRKTGALESVIPSSTGGYFLHYQCKLNGN